MIFRGFKSFMRFGTTQPLRESMPLRNGGLTTIPRKVVEEYCNRRIKQGEQCKKDKVDLIRSVRSFKQAIEQDPILKMCFIGALNAIPKGGVLHGKSIDCVMNILNAIAISAPKFENISLAGVPFYSLFIDFLDTRFGEAFFANPNTNKHLKHIFNDYQTMLQSKVSLQHMNEKSDGWFCKEAQDKAQYQDYQLDSNKPYWGFDNWSDWFIRKLKPGARPIPKEKKIILHSSDSYPLTYPSPCNGSNPAVKVQADSQFWLKDNRYSLNDMLGAHQMGIQQLVQDHFVGGTVYQAFLDPWCYHRWHAPITGKIIKSYKLGGTYYLDNPGYDNRDPSNPHNSSYVDSQPMLSVVSVRQIYIIQLQEDPSKLVAVIEIGMAEVSGCHSTVIEGQHVQRGEQLGYFTFGGSSYVMIFDNKFNLTFDPKQFELSEKDDDGKATVKKQLVNSKLCSYT